ncbi:MAG: hypothetical protein ACHQ2Y_09880 [Candidatus Lutacidiplasmatales archaeon]
MPRLARAGPVTVPVILLALVAVAGLTTAGPLPFSPHTSAKVAASHSKLNVSLQSGSTVSAGCGSAAVPTPPRYLAPSKTSHLSITTNLNATSSACLWGGASASAEAFVELTAPISLSRATHNVSVYANTTYSASEWLHRVSRCPSNVTVSSWCETSAWFSVYVSAYVWDKTSNFVYCDPNTSSPAAAFLGSVCGPVIYHFENKCDWALTVSGMNNYLCPGGDGNLVINGSMSARIIIGHGTTFFPVISYPGVLIGGSYNRAPAFNSTHQYTLNITIGAIAGTGSYGWLSKARASVDLAGNYGSSLGLIVIR